MVTISELAQKYNLPYKRIFNCFYKRGITPVKFENDPSNYYKPAEVEQILKELANAPSRPYHAPAKTKKPELEPETEAGKESPEGWNTIQELAGIFHINPKTATYRLKAAGIDGVQLTHRGTKKYYDINEARPILITPVRREIAELKTYYAEQSATEETEYAKQPAEEIENESDSIDYNFEPPAGTPDRAGCELTAEMCAVFTEFFGFEGARRILINNYGLKPWKVA